MSVREGQRLDRLGQSVFGASVSPGFTLLLLVPFLVGFWSYHFTLRAQNHTETYYHSDKGSLKVSYSFQDKEVSLTTDQ